MIICFYILLLTPDGSDESPGCAFVGHTVNDRRKIAGHPNLNSELSVK